MILYKYVDYETGLLMMEKSTVAFTRPSALNDPFETSAAIHPGEFSSPFSTFNRKHSTEISFLILSLTRNPLNPIMWSHYGRSHTGFVFGIDCNLAGLNSEEDCVLPAKYGSIIYTKSKPIHSYEKSEDQAILYGTLTKFDVNYLEALQRIFLHKSVEWAYEEEVRVVRSYSKIIEKGGASGNDLIDLTCPRFIVPIPSASIVSVHIGKNPIHKYLEFDEMLDKNIQLCKKIKGHFPHIEMFDFQCDPNSWNLKERKLSDHDWENELYKDYHPD